MIRNGFLLTRGQLDMRILFEVKRLKTFSRLIVCGSHDLVSCPASHVSCPKGVSTPKVACQRVGVSRVKLSDCPFNVSRLTSIQLSHVSCRSIVQRLPSNLRTLSHHTSFGNIALRMLCILSEGVMKSSGRECYKWLPMHEDCALMSNRSLQRLLLLPYQAVKALLHCLIAH